MRIKAYDFLFCTSYCFIVTSLFINDVYRINQYIDIASQLLRYSGYVFLLLSTLYINRINKKELMLTSILEMLTLIYAYFTKDLYWALLLVILFSARKLNYKKVFKISLNLLATLSVLTVILCFLGFLPDYLTDRNVFDSSIELRHSFGFYHSNVLPIIVLYLESYYIVIKEHRSKTLDVLLFGAISCILYITSDSRNAFILSLLLTALFLYIRYIGVSKRLQKLLDFISKIEATTLSMFSVAMTYLLLKGGIWDVVDSLFSGRFRLAIFKIRRVGIHLLTLLSTEDFMNDNVYYVTGETLGNIPLDNGYLYVLLRYGVLALLFILYSCYRLSVIIKGKPYLQAVIIIVLAANFVDNDLFDYLFIPFFIMAYHDQSYRRGIISWNQ